MSYPPIYLHTLSFTVTDVIRGKLPAGVSVGGEVTIAHSAHQIDTPTFPAIGTECLVGAEEQASRGPMMLTGDSPAAMSCLRLEERTDAGHADVVLACSLPFGWRSEGGSVFSPWATLGSDYWAPCSEGSTLTPAPGAALCSVTGRPVLQCGGEGALQFSCALVPPSSAEDPAAPSEGGKPRGQWPGGWHKWTNPDGDGEYRLTLTNTSEEALTIPALIRVGEESEPCWAASLLIEHCRLPYTIPSVVDPASLSGVTIHPTVLEPGGSVSTIVNILALEGPRWPRGGSRVEFTFWLGEASCGPVSFYYYSSHHDVLRRNMGLEMEDFQGE